MTDWKPPHHRRGSTTHGDWGDKALRHIDGDPLNNDPSNLAVVDTHRERLSELLVLALPFVEMAADDPAYKASGHARIRKLAKDIRRAIEESNR